MSNVWTLLITDDCQEDREVYREYLSGDPDQSYRFIEAGSAEMGLALCRKQHCDAILLDFCLPDMTGLEFLDELNQQLDAPLPVIMLTGQGDERIAVQSIKRGAQDYLVKQDLEPDTLKLTVRNAIHQSRLQTQVEQFAGPSHPLSAEAALHLHRSLDLEEILQTAVSEVQQTLNCDRVAVYQLTFEHSQFLDDETSTPILTKRHETGLSGRTRDPIQQFIAILHRSTSGQMAAALPSGGTTILQPEAQSDTYLLAPILLPAPSTAQPQPWGLLVAHQTAAPQQWQSHEVGFVNDLVNQLGIALHQSEQLTQALTALEREKQLSGLKSQLVALVSHEYRSPLATILAAASTLKRHSDKLPEVKQQQFFQMIETKARQMAQLVDDLLVLETVESGQMNFTPQPFELLQFVSDLIDEYQQTVGCNHELVFKITGNTKGFLGDRQLLRLILTNLLSNAIKYSTESSEVMVHLNGSDRWIQFEVQDSGIGIPADDQPQIFQSFRRGHNVTNIPGTGVGLAIVKACVDLYGGTVTMESQVGQGTQVTVCLPKRSVADLQFE